MHRPPAHSHSAVQSWGERRQTTLEENLEGPYLSLANTLNRPTIQNTCSPTSAFGHPDEDWIFFGVSTVALILFAFELVISSIGKRDYFLGFYFFLDFISTVSLIPDTGLIDFTEENYAQNNSDNEALKAGRASKASKATRGEEGPSEARPWKAMDGKTTTIIIHSSF